MFLSKKAKDIVMDITGAQDCFTLEPPLATSFCVPFECISDFRSFVSYISPDGGLSFEELSRQEIFFYDRGFDFVEVPDEEFESMACNVLAISPSKCLMVEGNPKTKEALERKGCTVFTYSGANISVAGGGGPTCLTRPLKRKLL